MFFLWYLGCFHGGGWCLLHGVRPRTWNIRNGFQRRRLKSGTWPAKEIQTKSIVWAELSSMKYYHHPLLHYGFRRSYLKQKIIAGIIALPTYTLSWCTRGSKMMCNVDIHEQQWKDVDLSIILFICLLFGEMIETLGKATPLFFNFQGDQHLSLKLWVWTKGQFGLEKEISFNWHVLISMWNVWSVCNDLTKLSGLETVLDFDQLVVLDQGEVAECCGRMGGCAVVRPTCS